MSTSHKEELIALLASICAILCFGFGFNVAGWLFFVKAVFDYIFSMLYAIREIKAEKSTFFRGGK